MRKERTIHLLRPLNDTMVTATLIVGVSVDEVDEAVGLWSPYLRERITAGTVSPQHAHWNWSKKARIVAGMIEYVICGIATEDGIQGLMLREDTKARAKHPDQLGTSLVYITFISTAPWNDAEIVPTPAYRGCGTQLLREAIEYSYELGYKGRIGLHALPQSESFYLNRCGMVDLGPDPSHQGLRYFEFTKEGAKRFLGGDKNGGHK